MNNTKSSVQQKGNGKSFSVQICFRVGQNPAAEFHKNLLQNLLPTTHPSIHPSIHPPTLEASLFITNSFIHSFIHYVGCFFIFLFCLSFEGLLVDVNSATRLGDPKGKKENQG
jgi:hypothetical protein